MNRQPAARLIINFAMTVLLLCAYAYRIIGDVAHEWIGIAVFASFVVHNAINWRWYKSVFKGKYTLRRTIVVIVNVMLVFTMTTLLVTGLLQSRTVLAFLHLPGDMLLRQAHTTAAYWGLPLIGVHVGLHWEMIMNWFGKMTHVSGSSIMRKVTLRAISVMIVIYGVYASFDRDMGAKLFLGYSFDYWNPDRPAILFFTSNMAIMGVYVFATYYALKLFASRQKVKNDGRQCSR
jgi:hypothetical protein